MQFRQKEDDKSVEESLQKCLQFWGIQSNSDSESAQPADKMYLFSQFILYSAYLSDYESRTADIT